MNIKKRSKVNVFKGKKQRKTKVIRKKKSKKQKGGAEPEPKTVKLERKGNKKYGIAFTDTEINGKVFVFVSGVIPNSIASDQKIPEGSQITKINGISLTPETTRENLEKYINQYPNKLELEYIYNKAEYDKFKNSPERLAQLSPESTRVIITQPSHGESDV